MATLKIYNEITTEDGKQFNRFCMGTDGVCFKDIDEFIGSMAEDDNDIDIRIHCEGGSVTEGWAIYDKLRASGKNITCTVEGKCASMATIILLSAPKENRKAYKNANFCVHNPWMPTWALGDAVTADDLEKASKQLKEDQERILNLYVERCECDREEMQALMNEDKYIDSERAKALGLIAQVLAPVSAKKTEPINNNKNMNENKVEVKQSLLDKILAKVGLARIEDVVLDTELSTADGSVITIEREEGEPQVGDVASPDGEHVMPDGRTIVIAEGVISEIKPAEEEEEDDAEALKKALADKDAEIADLKAQLDAKAKTTEDLAILNAVKMAGGTEWLAKACSTYKVAGRKVSGVGAKKASEVIEESAMEKELRERKEKFGKK